MTVAVMPTTYGPTPTEETRADFPNGVIRPLTPCSTRSQLPASNNRLNRPNCETICLKYALQRSSYAYCILLPITM